MTAQEAVEHRSEEESDDKLEGVPLATQLIHLAFPRLALRKSPSQALAP
jgi:hypothetical protein